MRCRWFSGRSVVAVVVAAVLLLPTGGCVPLEEEQLAEFFRDLLLSALAAFLL